MITDRALRLMFGFFLVYVAGRMLFRDNTRAGAALFVVLAWMVWIAMRLVGWRLSKQPYWPSVYRAKAEQPAAYDYEI
jgi:hypothetical protein